MFYCYILYSTKLDRYYIGSTQLLPEQRLQQHLNQHYENNKFTANAHDWVLFFSISCMSIKQARQIERHIKAMKSKQYIRNLRKYPELSERLIIRFSE